MKILLTILVFMGLKIYELLRFIFTKVIPVMVVLLGVVLGTSASCILFGFLICLCCNLGGASIEYTVDTCLSIGAPMTCVVVVLSILCVVIKDDYKQNKREIKQFFKDNWNKAEKIVNRKKKKEK